MRIQTLVWREVFQQLAGKGAVLNAIEIVGCCDQIS
jgi:hypothetical protein